MQTIKYVVMLGVHLSLIYCKTRCQHYILYLSFLVRIMYYRIIIRIITFTIILLSF